MEFLPKNRQVNEFILFFFTNRAKQNWKKNTQIDNFLFKKLMSVKHFSHTSIPYLLQQVSSNKSYSLFLHAHFLMDKLSQKRFSECFVSEIVAHPSQLTKTSAKSFSCKKLSKKCKLCKTKNLKNKSNEMF